MNSARKRRLATVLRSPLRRGQTSAATPDGNVNAAASGSHRSRITASSSGPRFEVTASSCPSAFAKVTRGGMLEDDDSERVGSDWCTYRCTVFPKDFELVHIAVDDMEEDMDSYGIDVLDLRLHRNPVHDVGRRRPSGR